jgi:hypothetical protein
MIIDRRQQNWIFGAGAAALASTALYLAYALNAPNGPRGGSLPGLLFGFAGTGLIVFECLLSLRKKYPASPLGRIHTWLKAHTWLGLLSFLLILFHAGFDWGEGLAAWLMWIFLIISASGILGLILQWWIPRRMTSEVRSETVYEQIPEVVRTLRFEADERIEFLTADLELAEEEDKRSFRAGGKKYYYDPVQYKSAGEKIMAVREKRKSSPQIEIDAQSSAAVRAHYLQEIRPFLTEKPVLDAVRLFSGADTVTAYFNHLRTILPVASHEVLHDVEEVVEERRQLLRQESMHRLLHGWLLVHVPLSFAFLVLTAVHAVVSLRYGLL